MANQAPNPTYDVALNLYKENKWEQLKQHFDINKTWWKKVLKPIITDKQAGTFGQVLQMLADEEKKTKKIFPQLKNLFAWTRVPDVRPNKVKVIIVGQEPIANGHATGFSFLLRPECTTRCPSIDEVFNAIVASFPDIMNAIPEHSCPYSWAKQGVLLLNTFMTVSTGADDDRHDGWQGFTTKLLKHFIDSGKTADIVLCGHYWKTGDAVYDGSWMGKKGCPFDLLKKQVVDAGDKIKLMHTSHPREKDPRFVQETTGQRQCYCKDINVRNSLKLFSEELPDITWTSIVERPTIPEGVIYLPNDAEQEQQRICG